MKSEREKGDGEFRTMNSFRGFREEEEPREIRLSANPCSYLIFLKISENPTSRSRSQKHMKILSKRGLIFFPPFLSSSALRYAVVACLVVCRLTEDVGGEDERNDFSGREKKQQHAGSEGRNSPELSAFLLDCIRVAMSSCRPVEHNRGANDVRTRTDRACKPVLVPCSTSVIPRLGNTGIPYQRRDHRQDWQVLCRHRPIRKENRTAERGHIPGEQRREERLYCTEMIRPLRLRTTTRIHPVFYEEIVSIFLYRFTYGPLFSLLLAGIASLRRFTTRAGSCG